MERAPLKRSRWRSKDRRIEIEVVQADAEVVRFRLINRRSSRQRLCLVARDVFFQHYHPASSAAATAA
jgi:hypothetical protein